MPSVTMALDLSFWLEQGEFLGLFALFGILLLGIRSFTRQINGILGNLPSLLEKFIWEDSEEVIDGKKTVVRKPSKALVSATQALAPLIIAAGLEWAKKNIPRGPGGPGPGAGGLGGLLAGALPKKYQAFAGLIEPLLGRFLGGGGAGKEAAAGILPTNPFAKP